MNKRGLSAIITTILLISLIIVIVGVIFVWMRGTNTKLMGEGTEEKTCSELQFDVGDFCYKAVSVGTLSGTPSDDKPYLNFNVRSTLENQKIIGFLISVTDNYGNIETISTLLNEDISGMNAKTFRTDFLKDIDNIGSLKITPRINVDGKSTLCKNKEVSIQWTEVKIC